MSEQMDLVNSMLRCPCCGGAVTLCYDPTMVAGQRNWIRCNECGLRSAYHRTCHSAIAAWNQRAGEADYRRLRDLERAVREIWRKRDYGGWAPVEQIFWSGAQMAANTAIGRLLEGKSHE